MVKKFFLICAFFIVVGTYLLLSMPALVSTKIGTKTLISVLNKKIPGKLSVKELSLSWFGPQTLLGLSLHDKEGDLIFKCDTLSIESSLVNFFQKDPYFKSLHINGLHAKISEDHPKITNIHLALGVKKMPFGLNRDKVEIHLPFAKKISLKKNKNPFDFTPRKVIVLNEGAFSLEANHFSQPSSLKVFGKTLQGDLEGSFDLQASVVSGRSDKWNFNRKCEIHLSSNIVDFPVDLLDLIFTSKSDPLLHGFLRDALGDRISLKIDQILTKENASFEVTSHSPTLNASLRAELINGKLSLQDPGKLTFTFTPELFERFASQNKNTPFLRLVSPTKTTLVIEALSLPLYSDEESEFPWNVKALSFDASLDLDDTEFTGSPFWGELALKGIRSTIEASETGDMAEWHLRGEANQNGRPLQIRLDASLKKPADFSEFLKQLKDESKLQFEIAGIPLVSLIKTKFLEDKPLTIKGTFCAPHCHLNFFENEEESHVTLDLALGRDGLKEIALSLNKLKTDKLIAFGLKPSLENKVLALFGDTLEGRFGAILTKYSGPLKGELIGTNGLLSLNGQLKNGVLTLKKPLKALFDITPQFAKEILGDLMPVFAQICEAEERLAFSIDPKGFSLPLLPFQPYFAKIDEASLEIGRVLFKRNGEIATLVDLLEADSIPKVPVCFAPIHFKLKSGIVHVDPVDILFLDQFRLKSWGKIDLIKDKVQMTFGVTSDALKKAFGLEGLANDFILQFPLKGHLSEAKIDRSQALIQLSALVGKDF